VSAHRSSLPFSVAAFAVATLLSTAAPAEPSADQPAAASPAGEPSSPKRAGFELLAFGGYGHAMADVRNTELQPYDATVGLDVGYTFHSGFRLGASAGYGFGHTVRQTHDPVIGDPFDFDADSSSLNLALVLAYDVRLYSFLLRYGLGFGGTFMRWDLSGIPPESVFDEVTAKSPTSSFFLAPGVTLLWPHDTLQCGVGFDYLVQANGAIPPGFVGKLLVGVKL